ncbi:WUSCHEL-related homeobox 9-like [Apium graveolens]|uniref:WUSCHEL-related homeobox 9-like n=1 Tax=Apium graveolens TaxID=4045 RepID=UPI003D7957B7
MASSNRHWPSQFKSKPQNHQWQQQEHSRTLCDSGGSEERSKDLKPRWNPKPEQIRILEAIFNSGMINPPRDEIRRIRVQLQEYGQVGDANVFYWFQNRKSRSKQKQQQRNTKSNTNVPTTTALRMMPPPSYSSSSSGKSSRKASRNKLAPFSVNIMTDNSLNSPTASVNHHNFHPTPRELLNEPLFFPVLSGGNHASTFTQGLSFPEVAANVVQVTDDHTARNQSNILLSDLIMNDEPMNYKKVEEEKNKSLPQQQLISYGAIPTTMPSNSIFFPPNSFPSIANNVTGKSMVTINDVRFEVPSGPLNVREAFGDDAVLVHSSGQPVVTDKWGLTLHPLQHGASYYLI